MRNRLQIQIMYPEGNLNDIKITVKKSDNLQTGDLVTVKIPANMIPLRYYEVSKGKMTISETYQCVFSTMSV